MQTPQSTTPWAGGQERLLITVHGIRTFGPWQENLEEQFRASVKGTAIDVRHYRYGFFTILAFLIPFLRWITTMRFRAALRKEVNRKKWSRIDIVAHSFGTHLVGWTLLRMPQPPAIHTVIFAGSVLRASFPVQDLIARSVGRLVNDCGIFDNVLLANQLFVLFTGMAGRVGFIGMEGDTFRNRYFSFGHSGYFVRPDFIRKFWIPILVTDDGIPPHSERGESKFRDLTTLILNNAEPIKLACYISPLLVLLSYVNGLRLDAQKKAKQLAAANVTISQELAEIQRRLILEQFRDGRQLAALTSLSSLLGMDGVDTPPDLLLLYRFWRPRMVNLSAQLPSHPSETLFKSDAGDFYRDTKGRLWKLGDGDIDFWALSSDHRLLLSAEGGSRFVLRSAQNLSNVMTVTNVGNGFPIGDYEWSDVATCGATSFCIAGNTSAPTVGREHNVMLEIDPQYKTIHFSQFPTQVGERRYIGKSVLRKVFALHYPSISPEKSLYQPFLDTLPASLEWRDIGLPSQPADDQEHEATYEWNGHEYSIFYEVTGAAPVITLRLSSHLNQRQGETNGANPEFELNDENDGIFVLRNVLMSPNSEFETMVPTLFLFDFETMKRIELMPAPTGLVSGVSGVAINPTGRFIAVAEDRSWETEDGTPARVYISLYEKQSTSDRYERKWVIDNTANRVTALKFNGDNALLVGSGNVLSTYDIVRQRELWSEQVALKGAIDWIAIDTNRPYAAVYNSRELLLVATGDGMLLSQIYNSEMIKEVWWREDGSLLSNVAGKASVRSAPLTPDAALRMPYVDELSVPRILLPAK